MIKPGSTTIGQGEGRQGTRFSTLAALLLISTCGLTAYLNSVRGIFLFDDSVHIIRNERIRDLSALSLVLSGKRPVVDLSLALNFALNGPRVSGYHALNVLVHVLCALVLFGVVRRTLLSGVFCARIRRAASWLALAVALLWVSHPLQTQSVTYVIQRAESLMGLFYLLTLYGVIRGKESMNAGLWYAGAIASCAMGMGSKAVMVSAPLAVLCYDRLFFRESWRDVIRRRWWLYGGLAATWSVLWMCGIVTGVLKTSNQYAHVGFGYKGITPWEYLLTQGGVLVAYLRLSMWPHPLCLDYNWPIARDMPVIVPPAIVVTILLVVTARVLFARSPWGFPCAWFFLILAPTSSFIPIKDALFEHRMYLSSASVMVLLVTGGYCLVTRLAERLAAAARTRRGIGAVVVVVAVVWLTGGTIRRNRTYHSAESMWRDVVAKRPHNARGFENLGTILVGQGRKEEAIASYRRAVELDPDFASAQANLATALMETGRMEEAVPHLREVLRVEPNHARARINLGNALYELGRTEESFQAFQAAARLDPRKTTPEALARAHYGLGSAWARRRELDRATAEYREALRLWPQYARAHYALGLVFSLKGDLDEAIRHYDAALNLDKTLNAARRAREQARARKRRSGPH